MRHDAAPTGGATVAHLWDAYLAERAGRPVEKHAFVGAACPRSLWHLRPDRIQTNRCRDYAVAGRKAGLMQDSIWTGRGHWHPCLLRAQGMRLIPQSPHIARPPKPARRERYLTSAEIKRLLAAECQPDTAQPGFEISGWRKPRLWSLNTLEWRHRTPGVRPLRPADVDARLM